MSGDGALFSRDLVYLVGLSELCLPCEVEGGWVGVRVKEEVSPSPTHTLTRVLRFQKLPRTGTAISIRFSKYHLEPESLQFR